jgi:phosphatidylethanolamine-binding protein (PEBP) family uncharacterized protein
VPTHHKHPTTKHLAATFALLALPLLTAGCGSASSPPASTPSAVAAATTPTQTTPPSTPTNTTPVTTPNTTTPNTTTPKTTQTPVKHHHSVIASLGNAKPAPKFTPQQHAKVARADITLTSPAITQTRGQPATLGREYTCDGADHWPTLRWGKTPPDTQEIQIYIINTKPIHNQLYFDWAIAHINPTLHEIQAGQQPPNTTLGNNSTNHTTYHLCPPTNNPETYAIALYALPKTLNPQPNFNPTTQREQALHTAQHSALLITTYTHQ